MIGIDLVVVSRMAQKIQNESFVSGVFTAREIAYYQKKGVRAETLAGIFAAKEATAKALGTGFSGFRPNDIEVLHNDSGAPIIKLHNAAENLLGNKTIHVSISHDGDFATAVAMLSCE